MIYLIADNLPGLLVEKNRDSESPSVIRVVGEVDLANMGKLWVQWIGDGIFTRDILIRSGKAPS